VRGQDVCDLRNDIISKCDAWPQRRGKPEGASYACERDYLADGEKRKIATDRGSMVFEHPTQLLGLKRLIRSIKDLHFFP
jgi:hypothetical protein